MFQLHSGKYDDMLQAYRNLIAVMEEERDNLKNIIANASETMSGEAIDSLQSGYEQMLNSGIYEEMLQQLRDMRWSFEDLQTLVGQIVGVGRTLGAQFTSDQFVESGVVATTGGNSSIIELDETYLAQINTGCVAIPEMAKCLKRNMDAIGRVCGDLIDLTDAKEQFATAYTLANRLDNFQLGFNRYVAKVRDLEENIRLDFNKLIEEEDRVLGQNIGEVSQKQLMASLRIRVRRILAKSPLEWTDADYIILASTLEKAVEVGDTELIALLLNGCVDKEYGTLDYAALCELRDRSSGETKEILNALIGAELPTWNHAECMVEVSKEDGVLKILVYQDVLLEKDNRIEVTVGAPDAPGVTCDVKILAEEETYDAEYYEMAAEFIEKDETGAYKFEAVLQQDANMASATEQKVLALLFEDQIQVIETAPSREARLEYFESTESFVESLFRNKVYGTRPDLYDKHNVDQKWREVLQNNMSNKESVACGMLTLLGRYQPVDGVEWVEGRSGKEIMDVTITPQLVGVTLDVDFLIDDSFADTEDTVLYVPSELRTAEYVDTLDEEVLEHLNELGYDEVQIIQMYMLSDNVTDEVFVDQIMKADYKEAFLINPEELGNDAKYILPQFAVKLSMVQDEEGYCREVEQFVNALLFQNEEYCEYGFQDSYVEQYINLMAEQSGVWKQNTITAIWEGGISQEEANLSANMDSLWRVLYNMYYEDRMLIPDEFEEHQGYSVEDGFLPYYPSGESLLQIRDLRIDSYENIEFELMLCNEQWAGTESESFEEYNDRMIRIQPERDPSQVSQAILNERMMKLDEKIDNLWKEQTIDTALDVFGIFSPGLATGLKAAVDLMEKDYGEAVDDLTNFEFYEKYKLGIVSDGGEVLSGVIGYFEKAKEWQEQIETTEEDYMAQWFYCVDRCHVDETMEKQIFLSKDVYDYNVIQGIKKWQEYGCGWFVVGENDEVTDEESYSVINEELFHLIEISDEKRPEDDKITDEVKEVLEFMVFGSNTPGHETSYKSITEIDDVLFMEAVYYLDNALFKMTGEDTIAREYWTNKLERTEE